MGIVFGGVLIGTTGLIALFVIDAISFVVLIYLAIADLSTARNQINLYKAAGQQQLRDRRLSSSSLISSSTTISQLHSALPLYLKTLCREEFQKGFAESHGALFSWHLALAILTQLPVASCPHRQALTVSALMWAVGFNRSGLQALLQRLSWVGQFGVGSVAVAHTTSLACWSQT